MSHPKNHTGCEMVSIDSLAAHPKNRNTHPQNQIERLARILEYQGYRYPVKVSKQSGFVTSGHGRILAAKHMGWTHVPVSYQDYESDDQEYADMVADNAIASWAELDLSGINFDLQDLGPLDIDMLGLENFKVDVSEIDMPRLSDADREPFQQMAFHLHDEQVATVKRALDIAMKIGGDALITELNSNSNANALTFICDTFITEHGSDE